MSRRRHEVWLSQPRSSNFTRTDGVVPYVELMRLTDPSKVTMEMDCGWVMVGGGNPDRVSSELSHAHQHAACQGLQTSRLKSTTNRPRRELGQGTIDYGPILEEAAKAGNLKHCFVEQEAFNVPPMESLKIDADYMRKLGAT